MLSKTLMLLQSPFPPDIRLEKEIKSLHESGFKVVVLCNQYKKGLEPEFKYCEIVRIKAWFSSESLNKIFNFPLFVNPRFVFKVILTFLKYKPEFIHAHDLPMVPLALILKFLFGKKVIFDMHENYPQALRAFKKKGLHNLLLKNPVVAEKIEKFCVKYSDKIIVVVEESKDRLIKNGIPSEKIVVVSNTVDLDTFPNNYLNVTDPNEYSGKYVILYTGTVSPERDLETAVKSVIYLKDKIPNLQMLIIGDGKSVISLKEIIENENLHQFVKLIPWVGHENLGKYISIADICMIPQPNNEFINTTIPHKLFEYMALGKPVLVSDAIPLKRIVQETKVGMVFKSGNPKDFAEKVIQIKNSNIDFGKNGSDAVQRKYNWKNDAINLIKLYSGLKN